jgi:hypothetical protein
MAEPATKQEVVVTNIQMPFWSMVTFMVKWAIAAIPAIIILFILGVILAAVLGGIGGVMHR